MRNENITLHREDSEGQLAIDVWQNDSEIVIESTIAGISPDELDIDITNESVTIRGERRRKEEIAEDSYLYQECYWGRFSRSVILPQEIDPDKADAEFENGILRIHLPKMVKATGRKIKLKK